MREANNLLDLAPVLDEQTVLCEHTNKMGKQGLVQEAEQRIRDHRATCDDGHEVCPAGSTADSALCFQ